MAAARATTAALAGKAPLSLICQMVRCQAEAFPDAKLLVKNEELYDALAAKEALGPAWFAQVNAALAPDSEQPATAAAEAATAAAAAAAAAGRAPDGVWVTARARAGAAQLEALLGPGLLAQCEVFLHQFRPPRTRPPKPYAPKPAALAAAPAAEAVYHQSQR